MSKSKTKHKSVRQSNSHSEKKGVLDKRNLARARERLDEQME